MENKGLKEPPVRACIVRFSSAYSDFGSLKKDLNLKFAQVRKLHRDRFHETADCFDLKDEVGNCNGGFWFFYYSSSSLPNWMFLLTHLGNEVINSATKSATGSSKSFNALIVLQCGVHFYGFCFGRIKPFIEPLLEKGFGLTLGEKLFGPDSIAAVSSKFFGVTRNKAETEYYDATFYLPDFGETVSAIQGVITPHGNGADLASFTLLLEKCSPEAAATYDSLILDYCDAHKFDMFQHLALCVDSVDKNCPPQSSLPRMNRVNQKMDDTLNAAFYDDCMNPNGLHKFIIAIPRFDFSEKTNDSADGYGVFVCDSYKKCPSDDVSWKNGTDISAFLQAHKTDFPNIMDIDLASYISDELQVEGSFLSLVDAELAFDKSNYILTKGKWYQASPDYAMRLQEGVLECEKQDLPRNSFDPEIDLEKWKLFFQDQEHNETFLKEVNWHSSESDSKNSFGYREMRLNYYFAKEHGFSLYDRAESSVIVDTNPQGKKQKFEICDLYDKTNKMVIHVKIGSASSLVYALSQSLTSARFIHRNYRDKTLFKEPIFGPKIDQPPSYVEVLFFSTNKGAFSVSGSDSIALKLAYVDWYKQLTNMGYKPILVIKNLQGLLEL